MTITIKLSDQRKNFTCAICGQPQGINSNHVVISDGQKKFCIHIFSDEWDHCFDVFIAELNAFNKVDYAKFMRKF